MSHFSVLVVTDELPTDEVLHKVLQPYHEFECTGTNDEYVKDVDITDDVKADYAGYTRTMLRAPDGTLRDRYADEFFRDPTEEEAKIIGPLFGTGRSGSLFWQSKDWGDGKGYRPKVLFTPDGYEKVQLPPSEPFAEWVASQHGYKTVASGESPDLEGEHKYGYIQLGAGGDVEKVVDRTNPNKKWDWWAVGGRNNGRLLVNGHACNSCRFDALDLAAMKRAAELRRRAWADGCCTSAGGCSYKRLAEGIREAAAAHAKWLELNKQPRGKEYSKWLRDGGFHAAAEVQEHNFELPDLKPGQTVEEWIKDAPPLSAFAFLKDGQWSENGSMGWWGCVSDEKDDWPEQFKKLLDSIKPEQFVAVVDCHI